MKIEDLIQVKAVDGIVIMIIGAQKVPISVGQASMLASKLQQTAMDINNERSKR